MIKNILIILCYVLIILACFCITPILFMLLWNWIVPIFWATAPILTFWESLGIIVLVTLISKLIMSGKH